MSWTAVRLVIAIAALIALTAPVFIKPSDMEIVTKTDTLVVAKQIEVNATCVKQDFWGLPHRDAEVKCTYTEVSGYIVALLGPGVKAKITEGFAVGLYTPA
jgi:hypothetical protein